MSPWVNTVKRSVAHVCHEAGSALERRSGRHTNSPRVSRALGRVGAPGSRGHGPHGSISVTLSRGEKDASGKRVSSYHREGRRGLGA